MFVPLFAFFLLVQHAAGETGCPEPEDVAPCSCDRLPTVRLICPGLDNAEDLEGIFHRSRRYAFKQVHIVNSVLLSIPSEIFDGVKVKELYLRNVTLQTLFTKLGVDNRDIEKIQIESTVVGRTITAQNFTAFTSLKELRICDSILPTLSKLGNLLPKSIRKIILSRTETKSIAKGALDNVTHLDKFAAESCKLKKLSRDAFPRPFYARILSFNGNKLTSIPEDMFVDMPRLQFLSLMDNALSVIPESAFAGRTANIPYVRFEGNPLLCDCQLRWVIEDKPEVLGGACSGPEKLRGKQLRDLTPLEVKCAN